MKVTDVFVSLQLERPVRKGNVRRIRELFKPPQISMEECRYGNARFVVLHVPHMRKGVNWPAVEAAAGRLADRILLPDELDTPMDSRIRTVTCPAFEKKVLLHTTCEIIDRTRIPMYRRVLGLVDPEGAHSDLLYPLLRHFTTVRVATLQTERYQEAAEVVMELLGAPISIEGLSAAFGDCALILIPHNSASMCVTRFPCPLVTAGAYRAPPGCNVITGMQTEVLPGIRALCPEGTAPHRFAAALYDYCAADVGVYTARSLLFNYRTCTIDDAAAMIRQQVFLEN